MNSIEIWTRPIEPVVDGSNSWAVAVLSRRTDGAPYAVKVALKRLRLVNADQFLFTELFGAAPASNITSDGYLTARIPPTGTRKATSP